MKYFLLNKGEYMNNNSNDLLDHIDMVIDLAKPIFEAGATCALSFIMKDKFDIAESELTLLEIAFAKRDHTQAIISTYNGKIYSIMLPQPWNIHDGECVRPIEINSSECIIHDLTPNSN